MSIPKLYSSVDLYPSQTYKLSGHIQSPKNKHYYTSMFIPKLFSPVELYKSQIYKLSDHTVT